MAFYCPRCGLEATAAGACARDGEALARVSTHDLCGRRLGEYSVLAHLGSGAFGKVYRAVHSRSGMIVAIKLLLRPIDHAESKRVLVEARAAAMLSHPNVVKVHDLAYASDRRPYIVMQHLEGRSLARMLAQPLPVATAVALANDVLAGLAAAHAKGIVHRDLKPDNIFVTNERAVVVDFGLAKLLENPGMPTLTMTGEAIGTPTYMAPEQIRGHAADGRADLYAIGCVLFEMLTGRTPFSGTTYALFDAHLTQQPPMVTSLRPDVPAHIEAVIARALAKDPAARFSDATAMRRALAGTPAQPNRRRWPLPLAGAVVVVGGVIAIAVASSSPATSTAAPAGAPTPRPGSAAAIRTSKPLPPPRPTDVKLDANLEATLAALATSIEAGHFTRRHAVKARCEIASASATYDNPMMPPALRVFNRRYRELLDAYYPDIDVAKECGAAPPPAPGRKIAMPPPLDDEPQLDVSMENALDTIHEQLDAGMFARASAVAMICTVYDMRDRQKRDQSAMPPITRAFYRRYERLLRGYFPDLDAAECPKQ